MSTLTPNYGLIVPDGTDTVEQVRADYATNLNTIDGIGGGGSSGHTIVNPSGSDMPAESKLQFTGGVTVTDDSTNGKTVVDISGSSVVELTQAQYEALPDSKLTDDILYGLKDVKSFLDADILYLGTCYSLSERMVGCWTDGKPLYAKTLNPSVNVGSNTINHGIANLEKCIRIYGVCKCNNTNEQLPLPYVSTNSSYVIALGNVTATTYLVDVESGFSSIQECYITLFYTKTTDVAGSGTWTPSGVNAVHYDDTEKVIGTWFGETLYEKTIHIVEQSEQTNKNYTSEIASLNASHIKLKNAEVKLGSNGGNAWYTAPFWYDGSYNMCVAVSPNDMNIFSRGWKYTEAYVTLQYTKSS